jgi:hypothetical protein
VAAAALPFAAACGAGFNAASQQIKPNTAAGAVGDFKVNNVWVIVDPNSGSAEVIGAAANTGTTSDQLVSASADGNSATIVPPAADSASALAPGVDVADGSVTIPGGESVSFGEVGSPELYIGGASLTAGGLTTVKLTFAQAGTLTLTAQVETNTGLFVGYSPSTGAPSASANPFATASASATASSSASATAGATASAKASASSSPSASASATK